MRLLLTIMVFFTCAIACKKNNPTENGMLDKEYAGNSFAYYAYKIVDSVGVHTTVWDSTYADKIILHPNADGTQVTFVLTEQNHLCSTFQKEFTFTKNVSNSYTANNNNANQSHTFSITNDSLVAYMLKQEFVGNQTYTYELTFKGVLKK